MGKFRPFSIPIWGRQFSTNQMAGVVEFARLRAEKQIRTFIFFLGSWTCVAAVYFPFSGRDWRSERKCGVQKNGQNWGMSEREGGGKRKGGKELQIACSESQTFYWAPFAHEQEATLDWLLARQSKYDIRNLSFTHNSTSKTQQDQNRHGRVRRSAGRGLRILCSGNVERPFAKWQTHRCKTEPRSCN